MSSTQYELIRGQLLKQRVLNPNNRVIINNYQPVDVILSISSLFIYDAKLNELIKEYKIDANTILSPNDDATNFHLHLQVSEEMIILLASKEEYQNWVSKVSYAISANNDLELLEIEKAKLKLIVVEIPQTQPLPINSSSSIINRGLIPTTLSLSNTWSNWARKLVSKKKLRHQEFGFDLDLTYITPRLSFYHFLPPHFFTYLNVD